MKHSVLIVIAVLTSACVPRPTVPPDRDATLYALVDPADHLGNFAYRGYLEARLATRPALRTYKVPMGTVATLSRILAKANPCFHGTGCSSFSRAEFAITENVVLFDATSSRRYYLARKFPGKPTLLFGLLSVNLNEDGTYMNSGPLSCFEVRDMEDLYEDMLQDVTTWPLGPTVQDYLFDERRRTKLAKESIEQ